MYLGPTQPSPKQSRERDRKYLDTFHGKKCEVLCCPEPAMGAAHMSIGSYARGMKASDALAAGLCREHHRLADHGTREERVWVWLEVLRTVLRERYERWRDAPAD